MIKLNTLQCFNQTILCAVSVLALTQICHGQTPAKAPTRMPEVVVSDQSDQLEEEAPTGPYGAPAWTSARRFSTTRVYLQQGAGEVGFEQWWRGRFYRDGTASSRFQEEIEIGLPYRFQLDIYEKWTADEHRKVEQDQIALEVRWALADWGKIPLNPTLYVEYAFKGNRGADTVETKLLLGDTFGKGWHWGANFSCEQEVTGGHATELLFAQGISYTLLDNKLDVGVEMEFIHASEQGSRSKAEVEFQIGPSIQWRPTPRTHIDIVPLFGLTKDSPSVEAFVIVGIDFGPIVGDKKGGGIFTPKAVGGH